MSNVEHAGKSSAPRFAWWGIGPWILLLLAALACVQYLQHGEYAYLAAALVVVVVCAGSVLRLGWARNGLRVVAVVLAGWALISGVLMLQQWDAFDHARQHAMTQPPQVADLALWWIARAQRTWQIGLALKAIAVPLLLWLAWLLGRPAVRAQFERRRSAAGTTMANARR